LLPGRRGQVAFWNPFDHTGGNYNMAITAAPGKGKSAFTQEYMVALLGAGGRVWVIDAGRSYEKTCKLLGGQFIEFTLDTAICLNPFTRVTDIVEAMVMLKPLLASMARPVSGASEEELAFLEQAIKAAWAREGNQTTISTVAQWLNDQSAPLCKNLAHLLFSFTREGVYARFFEGACTVDFDNSLIVMELQELKTKKDLQRIVLQVLIVLISQTMYLTGRHQMKSCIIDEAWDLLDDDNSSTAKFIETGYRTARKFRGNFIAIAHSIADFHRNAMSRAAFHCADFKIILGQSEEAINQLKRENLMDIDGFTERLLKSLKITADYSECVIKSPDGMSVHRIIFDPYSRILYSTKGEEFDAVGAHVTSGIPLIDAIESVAREFHHV
jgi:conjugal transfer ATP-binding protein TraC